MNILQINASIRATDANSTRVANSIVARLQAKHPAARLTVRDLGATPPATLDGTALAALFTPAEQRSPEQAARVALDDALIAELQAADVLVLGVPMYNFGIPAQLKNWFDAIARNGVTFPLYRQRAGRFAQGQACLHRPGTGRALSRYATGQPGAVSENHSWFRGH